MKEIKEHILKAICYTDLVYGRIRKKLKIEDSNEQIEHLILEIINETPIHDFIQKGKNYYVYNFKRAIRITVNSFTVRIITVDIIKN